MATVFPNIKEIKNSKQFPAFVSALAHKLETEQYLTPGHFFRDINDYDLRMLNGMVETIATDISDDIGVRALDTVCIVGLLLAAGEGVVDIHSFESDSGESIKNIINITAYCTTLETLARKGYAKVFYDNITYDTTSDKPIAEATQLGIELAQRLRGEQ